MIKILCMNVDALPEACAQCYKVIPSWDLVKRVVKQGHLAVLRHGFATVHITGISRVAGRQILRKAHADYLEMSQRYVDVGEAQFELPESYMNLPLPVQDIVASHLDLSRTIYTQLRDNGMTKEDARYILPQAIETEIVMSGNLQMWWDFFNLRIDTRVQAETRAVAMQLLAQFTERCDLFRLHPKWGKQGHIENGTKGRTDE